MKPRNSNGLVLLLLLAVAFSIPCSSVSAQTPKEKQAVRQLKSKIDRAGKYFQAEKFEDAGNSIEEALQIFAQISPGASKELLEIVDPEYQRLQKAHQLLADAGQKLSALPALPTAMLPGTEGVSFKLAVAPILVAKCGNCHVNRNRGEFSAASYAAIAQSTMIAFGLPQDSRIIEVIENGEMPKGGLKVEPAELQTLKDWIGQGAKYDGDNPQQNLNDFVKAAAPADQANKIEVTAPTGNETVSFGLQIAPILVANCGQCHMSNDPRGELNMGNFQALLAGGESGRAISPGKSKESMLFKRIEAGEMPPDGKLDNKLIQLIGKWIDEGAKFDGMDSKLATPAVAAVAKAGSQSHEELATDRQQVAAKNWKLVMSSIKGTALPSQNFLVTGPADEARLGEISQLLERLTPKIVSALKTDSAAPLVKGKASVFVFDKRYDFSEFGKMVVQREIPREASGHWNYTITDAYATVLLSRNQTAEEAQVSLAQQIAALHVSNLAPDVPRWFADGLSYWVVKKILSREDSMKSLDVDAMNAASAMKQPDDFIKDRLPSDQAGLVSYLFVKKLKSKSSNFNRLMSDLQAGDSFTKSFQQSFGSTPEQMFGTTGKKDW